MDRRTFLKTAVAGSITAGLAGTAAAADHYFPTKVDLALFEGINRAKGRSRKTGLEKLHVPVIVAPAKVKAGEPFTVEVSIGERLHDMGPAHWIEWIELNIGNEPAGRADLQPKGYLKPRVAFTVTVPKEAAPGGKVTLMARERCNLHGYWESGLDIEVA